MPMSERRRGARGVLPLVARRGRRHGGARVRLERRLRPGDRARRGLAVARPRRRRAADGRRRPARARRPGRAVARAARRRRGRPGERPAGAGLDDAGLRRAAPAALRARDPRAPAHGRVQLRPRPERILRRRRPAHDRRARALARGRRRLPDPRRLSRLAVLDAALDRSAAAGAAERAGRLAAGASTAAA